MNFKNIDFNSLRRIILYFAVALVGVFIWNAWEKDHVQKTEENSQQASSNFVPPSYTTATTTGNPAAPPTPVSSPSPAAISTSAMNAGIDVKTDVLDVHIDSHGNLTDAKLLKYDENLDQPRKPMAILDSNPNSLYIAQSGLKASNAQQTEAIDYKFEQNQYQLAPNENTLRVRLTGTTASGLQVVKLFEFERNKYNIRESYQFHNAGATPWTGNLYQQIVRTNVPPKGSQHTRSYNGAAISSADKPYQKLPFKKLNEEQVNQNIQGGWVAMQQPYFLTAWIPPADQSNHYYSYVNNNTYTIGYVGPSLNIPPNGNAGQTGVFYAGPELPEQLKSLGKGLDLTIDYGWLWMISQVIFWVMDHIHSVVKNWGWSIIITTLIIKLIFYKLSEKSYVSMAKMRDIQPRLQALKDRYGEDKQGLSRATLEFYKKEKINPLGGCLPSIIQIPVFIALYYVLIESVQLRQAPFIFWIKDLSVHDPFYVLPVLMGLSMFIQQKLSPPPPDPTQAKMMMLLPVVFTIFFLSFPAGLVLYWLVNNCASILQQWYVMKTYRQPKVKAKKK